MENNRFIDKRSVNLAKIASGDYIPLFSGRPDREKVISSDDMLDLKIVLHTSDSVEELLTKV